MPKSTTITHHLIALLALCAAAQGELVEKVEGIELGQFVLKPDATASGSYDTRALRERSGNSKDDFYANIDAGLKLSNLPSRYNLLMNARYGYRSYATYTNLNDDFYTLAASLGTKHGPLLWDLSSSYIKLLDYNTSYDPGTGQTPDSILSQASKRFITRANIAYESKRFDKTALVPSYTFLHYDQEYEDDRYDGDQWNIHSGILKLQHQYTAKTKLYTGVICTLQDEKDEDGTIVTLGGGAEYQMTDKTAWMVELGYAWAEYDLSGSDQSLVSRVRGNWQTTKKVTTYIFGGNNYEPGYNGRSARRVYRLGYGATWQAVKKFKLTAQILHDYQEEIGDVSSSYYESPYDTLRTYFDLKAGYKPFDPLSIHGGLRYNNDQYTDTQTILTLGLTYRFY